MWPVLSVIIISHNQRTELKHCVDSVLSQNIPFEYEIIISDDRSNDGTFELAQEYSKNHPNIIASQCNSDECNPAYNSHRSGYNRCNGYKYATGRYIIHIDADDYFRPGSNVLQRQVEMLEKHPECILCMQNIWIVDEGVDLNTGEKWHKQIFEDGRIITCDEFVKDDLFLLNQAFVARRIDGFNPSELYGKRYVDSIITYHYLQYGDIVCVDACDYIYVKHPGAVTTSMKQNDQAVLWNLPIYIPSLIPSLSTIFIKYKSDVILHLVNLARNNIKISDVAKNAIADIDNFLYQYIVGNKKSILDIVRVNFIRLLLVVKLRLKINSKIIFKFIYKLAY